MNQQTTHYYDPQYNENENYDGNSSYFEEIPLKTGNSGS